MRIDILAIGSRGDVQPYVALGLGLQSAGHRVRLVTLGGFEELVRGRGLDHLSISGSPGGIVADNTAGRDWIERRDSTLGFLRGFVRVAGPLIAAGIESYWRDCRDVEAVIVSPMGLLVGVHVAERLGVPLIRTQLAPRPDWAGRGNLATAIGSDLKALLGWVFLFLIWSRLRHTTNAARRSILGLPDLPLREPFSSLDEKGVPVLDAYSPAVVPRPREWGDWIHVTGYWFLEDPALWSPPEDLVAFLSSGPAPVFVGFGSTPFPRPERTADLVVRALAQAGHRGVVVAGGSGLAVGRLSDDVLSVASVPHGWLFPQVCAVVHHGGAGVTGAALRAGRPSVVVPVFGDQPFWGQRVFELGAGPRPIPAKKLTDDALASAIRLTAGGEMRGRAAALGERIRTENGVARAVEVIHQHLGVVSHGI
jgi:UDP:flavonoid glycosyltransferase YjiC (YdhE family)